MNISNTISYDSTYSNRESPQVEIKQNTSYGRESVDFANRLNGLNKRDSRNGEEKIDDIDNVLKKSNEGLQAFDRKLEMSVHEKTREVMVKVIDTVTDETIREIPPEKVLDTIASRKEMLGILMDKKI